MADNNTPSVTTTEKQIENTKEKPWLWKPGESGNPHGRPPKGHSITETIRAMMDEKPEIKKALGAKILQMAVEGDITAIKTIWGYIDGMPMQKVETRDVTTLALDYGKNTNESVDEPTAEAGDSVGKAIES